MQLHTRRGSLLPAALLTVSLAAAGAPSALAASGDSKAVPGEYVVRFEPGTTAAEREAAVAREGGRLDGRIAALDVYRVVVDADRATAQDSAAQERRAQRFEADDDIAGAEPNYIYRALYTPNDPSLGQQYAWSLINAFTAWDTTRGSATTKIAVIDTGLARTHPDLDAKVEPGYDWVQNDSAPDDANGHGTHVSGTAAAETSNGTGGAGMCPECHIMPLRVLDANGTGSLTNVASAITYAADHGAPVINMSLGGPGSSTLQNAVDYAWNRGTFLACAAGNDGTSSTSNAYPGAYANCFAVASVTRSDTKNSWSNYGSWVEVAAPGDAIYSTWLNNGYNTISGTSMATPHVAGLAGLLASQGRTNAQIKQQICDTAKKISGTGTYWSCGRIDAAAAVGGSAPPPPSGGEAIVNGGFEAGTSPWTQYSSGGYQLITTTRPHTGSYSAYLGGYNYASESVSQAVTVPSNGTLRYWWYMTTSEYGWTPYDYLRVRIYDASTGALLATPRTWSNASGAGLWRQDSLSLAAYAGRAVRITFAATTDYSLVSSFFVDDVSLQ